MSAKEMFEELGFSQFIEIKKSELTFDSEIYIDKIIYNGGLSMNEKRFCQQVVFDKIKKIYDKHSFNNLNGYSNSAIDMELNKAIQKQIEELGWE
jgi:hypothetical protein